MLFQQFLFFEKEEFPEIALSPPRPSNAFSLDKKACFFAEKFLPSLCEATKTCME